MFELSIALKYLIPRKRHLSVTLIAMMSTGVISLVVWLLLVFLSVTEGMEKTWLKKLTDLNAPIRIIPTTAYFSSYYYKVDSLSSSSGFSYKTLGEKLKSIASDPYDEEEDPEVPSYWPKAHRDAKGNLIDPVKKLETILSNLQKQESSLLFQDYEMSGATLKLQMLRNRGIDPFSPGQESMNFLTQVSYLATPPKHPKLLSSVVMPPSAKDIQHLFFLAGYRMDGILSDEQPETRLAQEKFQTKIESFLQSINITALKTIPSHFHLHSSMLPEDSFVVHGLFQDGMLIRVKIPLHSNAICDPSWQKGVLQKTGKEVVCTFADKKSFTLTSDRLALDSPLVLQVKISRETISSARRIQDLQFFAEGILQGKKIQGTLPWKDCLIHTFDWKNHTQSSIWNEELFEATPILAPKGFQDNGVLLGDIGFLSYTSSTASAAQELRTPVIISGFYDPGILSVGNKCLLVPKEITQTINSAGSSFTFDKIDLNGFQVWFDNPARTPEIQKKIEAALAEAGLSSYWKISTFKDYDFAKDLLQQFQSDKYLFSLIGVIILLVACCNILSFLILLVSDKKKEIAILQAMGASKKSIALIFSLCGISVGTLGCLLGVGAALLTLSNIDTLVHILSSLQGHDAFHQTFYGSSLPSVLSSQATFFIIMTTPVLSLLAGLIPAIKACRLNPSSILRSES